MENLNLANDLLMFQTDFLFFQQKIKDLRKDYLNKFVAIKEKKIICSASSFDELTEQLKNKGIDIGKIVVEYVSEDETFMVL